MFVEGPQRFGVGVKRCYSHHIEIKKKHTKKMHRNIVREVFVTSVCSFVFVCSTVISFPAGGHLIPEKIFLCSMSRFLVGVHSSSIT